MKIKSKSFFIAKIQKGRDYYVGIQNKDKSTRFERYDVLGILKKEHYPEWLTKRLEAEKSANEKPRTKPKKQKNMER